MSVRPAISTSIVEIAFPSSTSNIAAAVAVVGVVAVEQRRVGRRIASAGVDREQVRDRAGDCERIGDGQLAERKQNRGRAAGGEGRGEFDRVRAADHVGREDCFAERREAVAKIDRIVERVTTNRAARAAAGENARPGSTGSSDPLPGSVVPKFAFQTP